MTQEKPRWQYRFDNYRRAISRLREAMALSDERKLSDLERDGAIRRYKSAYELAWNTLGDYLGSEGVALATITPKNVIVAASEAKIIENHERWMSALNDNSKVSEAHNLVVFSQVILNIRQSHLALFESLHDKLAAEITR